MSEQRTSARLAALAAFAFALFNYPLLRLFDVDRLVWGVPLVWLYVFVVWSGLIVLLALTMRGR